MRELKFRIWDKEYKEMLFDPEYMVSSGGKLYCNYSIGKIKAFPDNTYILQQFTGLKDKNGKEIYEGDILEGDIPDVEFVKREMKEYNYTFWERGIVTYYPELARFGLSFYSEEGGEGYTGRDQHIDLYAAKQIIIGNIYQNPDLLK
jgi:uncharacterized phage protein (TIGR01671 family)